MFDGDILKLFHKTSLYTTQRGTGETGVAAPRFPHIPVAPRWMPWAKPGVPHLKHHGNLSIGMGICILTLLYIGLYIYNYYLMIVYIYITILYYYVYKYHYITMYIYICHYVYIYY
jgi:hypothetical protein